MSENNEVGMNTGIKTGGADMAEKDIFEGIVKVLEGLMESTNNSLIDLMKAENELCLMGTGRKSGYMIRDLVEKIRLLRDKEYSTMNTLISEASRFHRELVNIEMKEGKVCQVRTY